MDEHLALELGQAALAHFQQQYPAQYQRAKRISPATFHTMKAKTFLRIYGRIVYGSGFRAATVQAKFPALKQAFQNFDLNALARMDSLAPVLAVMNNTRKARCVLAGAKAIAAEGWVNFKRRLRLEGLDVLEELPGIGPITKYELAKCIGLADVPKPDRWLQRAATGESQQLMDVALWRYAVDEGLLKVSEP